MKGLLQNVLIAVLSSLCTFFLFKNDATSDSLQNKAVPVSTQWVSEQSRSNWVNSKPTERLTNALPDFTVVARKITDAVVTITAISNTGLRMSSGSGVIVSADGYIITNDHVLEEGNRYEITLANKRTLNAYLIGSDTGTDLALLKIEADNLTPFAFGNSDDVQVGEWVLAVGNPFDLNSTITAGIVSAKGRNINVLEDVGSVESFIQTDAVVNPGNSGGALVNTVGELIGINTAIMSESGSYEGYSFAIPSNLVQKVINDIRAFGKVQRADLGVNIKDINHAMAENLALSVIEGVYVTSVMNGSSAYEAGLRVGDVIVSVNGRRIDAVPQLQEQVALLRPGDRVGIEFFREGRKYRSDNIVLKSLTSETE